MLDQLLEGFRQHDRLALSRLLSRVSRGDGSEILAKLGPPSRRSRIIAVTGSGGVGKSTLVGKLIETIRSQGQAVAVLACDPESPLSGGALLGDRFRMTTRPDDEGVFIRSLATTSGQGAVAKHLDAMVRLLELFDFDVILVETVGAGQGDTAVREWADVVVLLLQPETGDDLQWEKAGVLEVADLVVIHKADLPGAEHVEGQVRAILGLSAQATAKVLRASSRTGQGFAELWESIQALPLRQVEPSRDKSELLQLAQRTLAARYQHALSNAEPQVTQVLADWKQGSRSEEAAAARLLQVLASLGTS